MERLNIKYHPWVKNATKGNKNFYIRVTEPGQKPFDIRLDTTDKQVAEKYCELRRQEVDTYNKYVELGEEVPDSVIKKLVRQANRPGKSLTCMTCQGAVEQYVEYCASRGLRPATQEDYLRRLSSMFNQLGMYKKDMPTMGETLIHQMVGTYNSLAPETRRGYGNCLKGFITWWGKLTKTYNPDLLELIPHVKMDRKEHEFWTMEEMMSICEHAPDLHYRIYWQILAETGARNNEVLLCKWEDLQGDMLRLKAEYTKGRRPRVLPLSKNVMELIGQLPRTDGRILHLSDKNQWRNTLLKRACRSAGVKEGTMHQFRHSAAIHYFRSGKLDIKDVQTLLGHADANTTLSIYIEATSGDELADKLRSALSL